MGVLTNPFFYGGPFLESIIYVSYIDQSPISLSISANVSRKTKEQLSLKDFKGQVYPITLFVSKSELPVVNIDKDIVQNLRDITGNLNDYSVAEIVNSTPETLTLGLIKKKKVS